MLSVCLPQPKKNFLYTKTIYDKLQKIEQANSIP